MNVKSAIKEMQILPLFSYILEKANPNLSFMVPRRTPYRCCLYDGSRPAVTLFVLSKSLPSGPLVYACGQSPQYPTLRLSDLPGEPVFTTF